jgi:hypothetical protein
MLSVVCTVEMPSLTLTTKLLSPRWLLNGVPDSAPSAATLNHVGPLTLANVSTPPLTSLADPARVAWLLRNCFWGEGL